MQEERYPRLKTIIAAYLPEDVPAEAITLESDLTQELNINSTHLVDIVLDVEDTFDITLENEDMDGMQTVQNALQIITRKITEKAKP